jgi:uncharacterized protein with HEPN domain
MAFSNDKQRIKAIIRYCNDIGKVTDNYSIDFDTFFADIRIQYSVSFAILQIGELATHLTKDFTDSTKSIISWRDIRGIRNHFVHGYDDMEPDAIWKTATKDIPELKRFCEEYLIKETL